MDDGLPAVELHIEELVLHGFPPGERRAIGEAVTAELTRLLGEPGAAAKIGKSRMAATLDAGSLQLARDARPEMVGAQLAQIVYQSLTPNPVKLEKIKHEGYGR